MTLNAVAVLVKKPLREAQLVATISQQAVDAKPQQAARILPRVPVTPAHLIRGIFTLGVAQVLTWIGGAALTVLLPRYLGDANLGKIAFGLAFTTLMGLVADLGTATFLTREVARSPQRALQLMANTLAMRVVLGGLAVALAVVVINAAPYDESTRAIVYVLCAGMAVVALSNTVIATLQGLQCIPALATFSVVTKLGYAAIAVGVLLGGAGPLEVALAWVASQAMGLLLACVALGRVRGMGLRWLAPDWDTVRRLLVGGLPFFTWQAALLVYGQVDAVLLSLLTQDAVVGWYSAAYRVVTIPMFLPTIVMTVMFPALSATATDSRAFNALARRAVHAVLLPGLPMALGIMLLPDKLVALFGYPESFSHSIPLMVLLAPHIIMVGVNMVIGTVLNTRDRQKAWALAAVAAALANPVLNFPAINVSQAAFGNGAIGASVVTTLTELFMLGAGLRLLPAGVFGRETAWDVLRCVAAASVMAIALWLARDLPVPASVAVGALVYGVTCLAVGAVSLRDLGEARQHLLRRGGVRGTTPSLEPVG